MTVCLFDFIASVFVFVFYLSFAFSELLRIPFVHSFHLCVRRNYFLFLFSVVCHCRLAHKIWQNHYRASFPSYCANVWFRSMAKGSFFPFSLLHNLQRRYTCIWGVNDTIAFIHLFTSASTFALCLCLSLTHSLSMFIRLAWFRLHSVKIFHFILSSSKYGFIMLRPNRVLSATSELIFFILLLLAFLCERANKL